MPRRTRGYGFSGRAVFREPFRQHIVIIKIIRPRRVCTSIKTRNVFVKYDVAFLAGNRRRVAHHSVTYGIPGLRRDDTHKQ